MKKFWLAWLLALASTSAFGQAVQQSGAVTARHIPYWVSTGVIGDGGTSAESPITSIGITNNGGSALCVNSDHNNAAGRNQLCFTVGTASPAQITLQNYGSAPAQGLQFNVNGTITTLPAIPGSSIVTSTGALNTNHLSSWTSSNPVLHDSGVTADAGIVTGAAWQATPIAVLYGGTGSTTAANARTALGLGTISQQDASAVAITGGTITGLPTPTAGSDAAIKSYVDALAAGLTVKTSVRLATAAVLPNSPTYSNGASGVGATLTAGSNTTLTVDGTVANASDRVLVKNQATAANNGVYTLTTAGDGSNAWVLTRATDFDQPGEMTAGSYFLVTAGSTNINSSYVLASTVSSVGSTAATFNIFAAAGVASLGGMSGAITCGIGIGCSSSTITSTAAAAGNLAQSGTSFSSFSANCGVLVSRSNSGTFMTDTLAVGGLTSGCINYVKNVDASAGYKITVSGGTLDGVSSGYLTLAPNQAASIQFDGTNFHVLSRPDRYIVPAAGTTVYVATTGNDANSGLASTDAWLTPTHAWNYIQAHFDLAGASVAIQLADGTYTSAGPTVISLAGTILGQNFAAQMTFEGNCGTPANVVISSNSGGAIAGDDYAMFGFRCMTITTSVLTHPNLVISQHKSLVVMTDNIVFNGGPGVGSVFIAQFEGNILIFNNFTINGGAAGSLFAATVNSYINASGLFITLGSSPTFNGTYYADNLSTIFATGNSYGGSSGGGLKYVVNNNSIITTGGLCNAIPGSGFAVANGGICN